jgi:hypothetical protein
MCCRYELILLIKHYNQLKVIVLKLDGSFYRRSNNYDRGYHFQTFVNVFQ